MTDFAAAFKAGQAAAKSAEIAKKQIADVIGAVAAGLQTATDGKLTIFEAESNSFAGSLWATAQLANRLSGKTDPAPVKERSIWAKNLLAVDKSSIRIAGWTVPHEGFPCVLAYAGQEVRCHDRGALEAAFADLLKDAWVGDQLGGLLAREVPQQFSDGDFERH
ncbi:hypothetical protein OKW40_001109 [Paraburkholderia sp. RAU6.4a]|uniref:hypothetical protein n=1 Tax=Paraburkholderia sp. RAU6.4a TaxID=2991067 RepID=UPI003D1CD797